MKWMKYKKVYFGLSALMVVVSLVSLLNSGLLLGVDFTGGAIAEFKLEKSISTEEITQKLKDKDVEVNSIQTSGDNSYFFKLPPLSVEGKDMLNQAMNDVMMEAGDVGYEELRFETVGPAVGPELVKKTIYAIVIAAGAIMLWVAYQFKSIKYGVSAILAMFHDTFILIGSFSLLGSLFGAETDFLFVTALLTTLSFSVHDTIVVYDRIRETQRKEGGEISEIADKAISETMVRSLNNSFTIAFMLIALVLLGGTTIKWFAVALFIGTILGTYSSPFVAVPLLVTWDKMQIDKAILPRLRKK